MDTRSVLNASLQLWTCSRLLFVWDVWVPLNLTREILHSGTKEVVAQATARVMSGKPSQGNVLVTLQHSDAAVVSSHASLACKQASVDTSSAATPYPMLMPHAARHACGRLLPCPRQLTLRFGDICADGCTSVWAAGSGQPTSLESRLVFSGGVRSFDAKRGDRAAR